MKHYLSPIIKAIILGILLFLFDLIIDNVYEPMHYAWTSIILAVFIELSQYLESKGWNSWSKIISLFKRK
ncbi:MAG: hypothetical protein Q4F34_00535 [Prevotellaceae bacterium]|nr:hypothetical protein [Prevotellaceae bacterium]